MNVVLLNTISRKSSNKPIDIKKQNYITFQGNLGDKYARQIMNGTSVEPKIILTEAKGFWGIKI